MQNKGNKHPQRFIPTSQYEKEVYDILINFNDLKISRSLVHAAYWYARAMREIRPSDKRHRALNRQEVLRFQSLKEARSS
jgi:hypothetical protein